MRDTAAPEIYTRTLHVGFASWKGGGRGRERKEEEGRKVRGLLLVENASSTHLLEEWERGRGRRER